MMRCDKCDGQLGMEMYCGDCYDVLNAENKRLRKALESLEGFARDISSNYDHDNDAHKYGTSCRTCSAEVALKVARAALDGRTYD